MRVPQAEHDLAIPSPTKRLLIGFSVILSIFLLFAVYTLYEVRWLEDIQVNVVQRNRKASLELLRLQNDAYLLAISIRDMPRGGARYPVRDWRAGFSRLEDDMNDALKLEGQFAAGSPASDPKRIQLHKILRDFRRTADEVFVLAQRGEEAAALKMIQSELESQRAVVSETVSRLLVLNDQAQAEANEQIATIYAQVKKDTLLLIAVLFIMALASGFYTLQANRRNFEKLQQLAQKLQTQSEQLRKLSWKLIQVQEETLRHVARDLHDEFGQILTAIGVMLSRAGQQGLKRDSPFVREVENVKNIVEGTLKNVRDSSQIFHPAILDDFGLEPTLGWFVTQFARQTGIQVHFEHRRTSGFFPAADAIHLYRIVQEGLSNIARHSGAREAWVSLDEKDGELNLEIRDNGAGFEVAGDLDRAAGEGIGLMGMRERAEHLEGSVAIRSAPGKGTVVTLRIPLAKPPALPVPEEVG